MARVTVNEENMTNIQYTMKPDTNRKADLENAHDIKTSELRYRRLFEAAQDGILLLDAETGMITDVNPFLVKMLGYTREEFVEKRLWEVGAFKDIEASQKAFEALQKNEYIRYEDLPLRAKNGNLIDVEFVSNV
jgi:PAS domain S-box-containing protein